MGQSYWPITFNSKVIQMNQEIKELYLKVLDSLELLGWEECFIFNDGFAVYTRTLGDEEFILNIDQSSVVVRYPEAPASSYESPEMEYLRQEVESLLIWVMLQKAIKEEANRLTI